MKYREEWYTYFSELTYVFNYDMGVEQDDG